MKLSLRVFDKNTKKMYYPTQANDFMMLVGDAGYFEVQNHANFDMNKDLYKELCVVDSLYGDLVLMRGLGILDIDKNEVFEGDTIQYIATGEIQNVEWIQEKSWCGFEINTTVDFKIIGNIYQKKKK